MQPRKMIAHCFVFALLASAVVAFMPSASAQGEQALQIKLKQAPTSPTEPLKPEISQVPIDFKFIVTVPPATVCPLTAINVEFTVAKKMDWASEALALLSTSSTSFTHKSESSSAAADYEVGTTLTVRVTRNAPAFKSGQYEVTAKARPGGGTSGGCDLKESAALTAPVTVTNDYLPIMEYQPAKYILKTGQNKEVVFTIKMTNFGNGQTRITSEVTPASKNKLDVITPPAPITLDSRAEFGEKANYKKDDAAISARTPHSNGYTNSLYAFTASFTATTTQAGWGGDPDKQSLTLSVQVQGVYVPGFDSAGALAGLGVLVVGLGFARGRRPEE